MLIGLIGRDGDKLSGSRQLPNHFSNRDLRMPTVSSAVASQIPHAAGTAWAAKVLGQDYVTICYFGDGATSKGEFHEAMNIAAVHKLPVVFFCENNGIAISVPMDQQMATPTIAERAAGYGMPGVRVDGLDPFKTFRVTSDAMDRARRGDGPTLIEATCVRMTPHSSQDDDKYRTDEEKREAAEHDPLPRFLSRLIEAGAVTRSEYDAWETDLRASILADLDWCEAQPGPPATRYHRWLYAED
jgi:2-oxoisovalerate dehydrogenase E1 component alpha subunit